MTRIKRGYIAQRHRTNIRLYESSFRGVHSRLTRTFTQQKIRTLVSVAIGIYISIYINNMTMMTKLNIHLDHR